MGTLLHFTTPALPAYDPRAPVDASSDVPAPRHPLATASSYPPDPDTLTFPATRDELKRLLAARSTTSPVGDPDPMSLVVARPFTGNLTDFDSPDGNGRTFSIKTIGVKENLARQNLSSKMRYVEEDVTGKVVTERDFPMGDMALETVFLALGDWNLGDENGNKIAITRKSIQEYLSNAEFAFLQKKVVEVNPIWGSQSSEQEQD